MRNRAVWLMAALLIGLAGSGTSHAQDVVNMLANGGFETGVIAPYGTYGTVTATVEQDCAGATVPEGPIEGKYVLHLVVPAAGANNWDMGMTNGAHTFAQGKKYTFACFMKTKSGTLQVRLKPELSADPWTAFNEVVVTVTDTWAEYYVTTPVMTSNVNPASPTFHFGFAVGDFWIDGIRLFEGDYVEPSFLKNFSAKEPSPADGAVDVAREVVLGWEAGPFAATHDVFFGDNYDDVNDATVADASQAETAFDPDGLLEFGKTYYWRVDEVNAPAAPATFKGNVWSFTVEPYAYTITGVTATASSAAANMGPEKTVDGSGLSDGLHSSTDTHMWLSNTGQPMPAWIQFDLGGIYKLKDMQVWNSNQKVESFIGFGAKSTTIEYSTDGLTWTTLTTMDIPRAAGQDGYAGSVIDMAGVTAKFVKLTIAGSWGGFIPQVGLSEVRFTQIPVLARAPQPASGSDGASLEPVLSWRPGREAVSHKVFLSGDREAVVAGTALAGTATGNTYEASGLEYGKTYYWRVDEVNDAAVPPVREGQVWSFSTAESFAVDDFESYNDDDNRIYDTWIDGLTTQASGSTVGNLQAPFAERAIIHDGRQAMPMDYDNSKAPFFSEAEQTFDTAQNWSANGADSLIVWFRGQAPGFAQLANGNIVMSGIGADIWNAADEFRYAYKTLNGDGTMVARVESIVNSDVWAKAGVMIRQSVEASTVHAFMPITPSGGGGASFQHRLALAGTSTNNDNTGAAVAAPYWVKIERKGNAFSGFMSPDGATWTQLGTAQTITMTGPVLIGLAVCSHNPSTPTAAEFSNITTTGGVTGAWQVADIGVEQPTGNSMEGLYLSVKDSSNKAKVIQNPNAAASATTAWQEWRIPLSEFTSAGVKMNAVKSLVIGVGNKAAPTAGGTGRVYIDDIQVGRRGSSDPGAGLAYYALENDVTDGSGNGHDGTVVGAPVYIDGPAGMGKALEFNGVGGGQRVTIGTWNPSAATGQLSVSLWAKWGGLTTFYQGLVGKRDNWAANDMMWQIEANITTGVLRLQREGAEVVGPTMPVGEWTHIVGAFDGAAAKMYVNGSVVAQGAFTFGTDPEAMMVFGDTVGGGGNPFNGALDEIHIYDRALSSFEVNFLAGVE